jgi:hypothetical protein
MISQTSSESAARGHKLDGSVDTGTASSSPSQNKLAYGESNDSTVRLVGGSLVLLVGGAILISVGWLLSLGVLQTLLWVLTAAMGFAAVSVAWNAFTPSSDPTRRTYLLIASASLAVVAFAAYWGLSQALVPSPRSSHLADTPEHGPGLSPSEPGISKEAIATQQNWMRMRQILVSLNGTSDFGEQRTLPGLISCLQRAQVAHSDAASEIAKLPIRDVDPEVVAFGASLIRLLNGSSAYFGGCGRSIPTDSGLKSMRFRRKRLSNRRCADSLAIPWVSSTRYAQPINSLEQSLESRSENFGR